MAVALRAESKIDNHERLCAERYERILENQEDGKADRTKMWKAINGGFAEVRTLVIKAGFGVIAALGGIVMLLLRKYGLL
jgi:hypothetical protein